MYIQQGDLLQSDCNVLIHQANCYQTMGAGIAKQIRNKYPEAYRADQHDQRRPLERLGSYSVGYHLPTNQYIVNLYAQLHYGTQKRQTDYNALRMALQATFAWLDTIDPLKKLTIGLPYGMGCGLAGGDWSIVVKIIEEVSSCAHREITIFQYR